MTTTISRPTDHAEAVRPRLTKAPALGRTRAVVLVLHGGRSASEEPTASHNLAVLRLVPFARRVRRATAPRGVAVWRLRYRYRGWNGTAQLPVADARWALDQVRAEHGDVPVVILGHSMGGRAAVHVADDPSVCAVVGLAPWLSAGDPVRVREGCRLVLVHGDADRITSLTETLAYARRARAAGADVTEVVVEGGEHFMLRRARLWHGLGSGFVREALARDGVGRAPRLGRAARVVRRALGATEPVRA